jgi:hypothetical protein
MRTPCPGIRPPPVLKDKRCPVGAPTPTPKRTLKLLSDLWMLVTASAGWGFFNSLTGSLPLKRTIISTSAAEWVDTGKRTPSDAISTKVSRQALDLAM